MCLFCIFLSLEGFLCSLHHAAPSLPALLIRLIPLQQPPSLEHPQSLLLSASPSTAAASPSTGRICGGHRPSVHLCVFSALPTLGDLGIKQGKFDFSLVFISLSVPSVLPRPSPPPDQLVLAEPHPPEATAFAVCRIHRPMKGD